MKEHFGHQKQVTYESGPKITIKEEEIYEAIKELEKKKKHIPEIHLGLNF